MMILSMLEEGKITSEEAIRLLEAIEETETSIGEEEFKEKDKTVDMEKAKVKMKEFEKVIKEQGKKVGNLGADLGNKISGFFNEMMDGNSPKILLGGYESMNTSLEKNISHIESPIIDFKSVNGNISVENWEKDHMLIKINCQYKNGLLDERDTFYDFYEEGNRLVFLPEISSNIMINLNVYLPDKSYDKILLNTTNGKIQISNFNMNKLQCNTTNASISAKDIVAQDILIGTKNGRIDVEDINSNDLTLSTVNGRVLLSNVITDDVSATTSNGSIDGKNINSEYIKFTTSNGKIILMDINPDRIKEIKLYTSNAPIDAGIGEIGKESYFDLETSLGNIGLEIPNLVYKVNKQVNLGTRKILAHSINFNEELEHLEFTAATSNGSIKLW